MIAMVGLEKYKLKQFNELDHPAKPRWPLDENALFLKGKKNLFQKFQIFINYQNLYIKIKKLFLWMNLNFIKKPLSFIKE